MAPDDNAAPPSPDLIRKTDICRPYSHHSQLYLTCSVNYQTLASWQAGWWAANINNIRMRAQEGRGFDSDLSVLALWYTGHLSRM